MPTGGRRSPLACTGRWWYSSCTARRAPFPGAAEGSNYSRFVVSYRSEGLKIYALMTVPAGERPETGWPVIIFNHGYIPPAEYRLSNNLGVALQRSVEFFDRYLK